MQDIGDQSTQQSTQNEESPLQVICRHMQDIAKELRILNHNVIDMSAHIQELNKTCEIVATSVESLNDKFQMNLEMMKTYAAIHFNQANFSKDEPEERADVENQIIQKPSFHAEIEKSQAEDIIDRMDSFKKIWQNRALPWKEKSRRMAQYRSEVNSVFEEQGISSKIKNELRHIRLELIRLETEELTTQRRYSGL